LFEGSIPRVDPDGRMIVDGAAGRPIPTTEPVIYDNSQHDFISGATSRLSYKGLSCNMVFDYRKGGGIYSRTVGTLHFAGITPATLYNDRNPYIIPNTVNEVQARDQEGNLVVDANGDPVYEYVENKTPLRANAFDRYWEQGGSQLQKYQVIDKTFIKLRELSISYRIPKAKLDKLFIGSATVSIIGRNLFLWTPESNNFIDPEMTTFGTGIEAEYGEFGATPTVRSIGASISFTF